MDITDLEVGMNCHLTPTGKVVFVVTEIRDQLYPVGISYVGQIKTHWYFQAEDVKPIKSRDLTNN